MHTPFPPLDQPQALLTHFQQWFTQGDLADENGSSMAEWQPLRVAVSPRNDLLAMLSQHADGGPYQRLDLYDLVAHQFIAMDAKSAYDAQPVFDLAFTDQPGHIRFIFDEIEDGGAAQPEPTQAARPTLLSRLFKAAPAPVVAPAPERRFWACGYSLERRTWLLPHAADLDTTPARPLSAQARAHHPWHARLPARPVAFGGAWHGFGVYYHLRAAEDGSGDFFASISLPGDSGDYVGRIAARTGALVWSVPIDDYQGFQPLGEWVVTDCGVLRAADGSELCRFAQPSAAVQCSQRQAHAAPDASLWVRADDEDEQAPCRYWRVDTRTGEVTERLLPWFQLLQHGAFWVGCERNDDGEGGAEGAEGAEGEGSITLHGLGAPGAEGFAGPALWTARVDGDLAASLCAGLALGAYHLAEASDGQWWALDLRSGAWTQGEPGHNAQAHCTDGTRLYITQGATHEQATVHWVDAATGETGALPLHSGEWRTVLVKDGVVYTIENLGTPFVTRYVPAAYDLATGERLWEGRHTRLCQHIVPTQHGIAVGSMDQVYFFGVD